MTRRRLRVRVSGTVQGVGFRPFVYRLAHEEGVGGHVFNDERGVELEIEGPARTLDRLLARLLADPPRLATIDGLTTVDLPVRGQTAFTIRNSSRGGDTDVVVTPDTATCGDCLRELRDPADRRHRYPFTNCTNCGPRLTIVEGVPYDRSRTTMRRFPMCDACAREYADPEDRRFHAQPNACPACGPQATLRDGGGVNLVRLSAGEDAAGGGARLLAAGAILALKGLGGYHLAARADDELAVATLRARKHRELKPFALMVGSPTVAESVVVLSDAERRLIASPHAPIVLARRRMDAPIAAAVAPGLPELGVMLAYTPIHHLLLDDLAGLLGTPAILVMTSGNVSDEPIAFEDADAGARLAGIADAFLTHDRPIRTRVDDSVARVAGGGPQMLRRARGYVPTPLRLPVTAPDPILACGAELKSTFCLARETRAWISHHIGDLEHDGARRSYLDGISHFEELFDVHPGVLAHDLHPDYASTAYALSRDGVRTVGVQHHHAHLAACLAEHGCDPDTAAVGAIFDGTGYGLDGTAWGGEILVGGLSGFTRAGSLRQIPLPGGGAAIREPWRVALAWLLEATGDGVPAMPAALAATVDRARWRAVARVAADRRLSPQTSSAGRLFDAVAALCGIAPRISYEGQAAVELAAAADAGTAGRGLWPARADRYAIAIHDAGTDPCPAGGRPRWELDPRALIRAVADDVRAGVAPAEIAGAFHHALARATADVCTRAAADANLDLTVLSGGVFHNRLLLESVAARLRIAGLRVLIPARVPPGDGGISFGQAAVAAAQSAHTPTIAK